MRQEYIDLMMQSLRNENAELQRTIDSYFEEIEKQKQLNAQHESQIETLLKFNQRLLSIIENELGNPKRDNCSLQPISQRSERESDMFNQPTVQSLIRSRKLVARSEWGGPTKQSLIERANLVNKKMNLFEQKSENESLRNEQDSVTRAPHPSATVDLHRKMSEGATVKDQMQREIRELREFKNSSKEFYERKVTEIRKLSDRLANYRPMEQINQITEKMALSGKTAELIRQRVMKNLG